MAALHAEFDLGNGDGDYTDLDASLKPIFGVPSNAMLLSGIPRPEQLLNTNMVVYSRGIKHATAPQMERFANFRLRRIPRVFSATSPLNFSSQLSKANRARGVTPLLPGNGVTLTVTETIPWVRDGK